MPGYKKHLAAGLGTYCLLLACFSLSTVSSLRLVEWCTCTLLGSLFPDIDIKSKGQLVFYHIIMLALLGCILNSRWKAASILGIMATMPLLARHRGIFHHFGIITAVTMSGAFYAASCWPSASLTIFSDACFFLAGVASHTVLDKGFSKTFGI